MNVTSKAICILGSGRCGTSMVTRSINLLGVDLGKDMISPDKTNPKGFWENQQIITIHQKILRNLGSGNRKLYRPGWWNKKEIAPLKRELTDYVRKSFANKEIWGWKDPRTNHCIDLWISILKELSVEPFFLIVIRNPKDVVSSFKRAYNSNENWAINRWKFRTLMALYKTAGYRRIIVDYNDFMEEPLKTLRRIANTFHLAWPVNDGPLKKELFSFIDPKLQHSKSNLKNFIEDEKYDKGTKELYLHCYKASKQRNLIHSSSFKLEIDRLFKKEILRKGAK